MFSTASQCLCNFCCLFHFCLIVIGWQQWASWSSCSASCGGGVQWRSRSCSGGAMCDGESTALQSCGSLSCGVKLGTPPLIPHAVGW